MRPDDDFRPDPTVRGSGTAGVRCPSSVAWPAGDPPTQTGTMDDFDEPTTFCERCGVNRERFGLVPDLYIRTCTTCGAATCGNCWNLTAASCLACTPFRLPPGTGRVAEPPAVPSPVGATSPARRWIPAPAPPVPLTSRFGRRRPAIVGSVAAAAR